jgi:hypothetical protein
MADTHSATASRETAMQKKGPPYKPKPPFFFELSRLMVVATDANGRLVYKAQTKPNGPWEPNWTPIDTSRTYGPLGAGLTGDGRVAAVAQPRSASNVIYIDEKQNTLNEGWNAPFDLGSPPGVTGFTSLALTPDAEGRLEVFAVAVGTDRNIWWKYQNPNRIVQKTVKVTPPGTHKEITITVDEVAPPLTPWSNWLQIPGGLQQIKALRNADGRVILFGINSDGHLYRNEQKVAQALQPSDWAGWVKMDDPVTGAMLVNTMAPTLDAAGAVNLFALNQARQMVFHARQSPPCTATWTGWSTPGLIKGGVKALAAGIDGDDHLVVVATDNDNFHNMNWQHDVAAQQWSGWTAFSTGGPTRPALNYNADGRLTFFSHLLTGMPPPNFGGLFVISQMAFDSTEWELAWTQLADKLDQYVVVRDLTPPAA